MRILYVITQSGLGGAQSHVRDLLAQACRVGEAGLIAGSDGPLLEAARLLGAKTWVVPSLTRAIRPWQDLRAIGEIRRIIRTYHPEVIHAHSSKAGIVARLAASKEGVPAIFTAHGWAFTENAPMLRRGLAILLERHLAPPADRIICVSEYDRSLALRYNIAPAEKLQVIHNALPDLPRQTDYPQRTPVKAVMVARFAPPKDQAGLLRAVAGLKLPVALLLVGEGEHLARTRRLAEQLSLSPLVHFLGAREDVPEILADSDIFILISDYEGFPYVTLEAMRAGLPVIASDVGGVKEAVEDGVTGFLVPRGNIEILQEKLTLLAGDGGARQRMGQAGRRRFLEDFPADKMLSAIAGIYRKTLH
jgi:glycosyltransferase involved in cell wall biosynthesis